MAAKKSKGQLEAELKVLRQSRNSEGVVQVLISLFRWVGIVLIVRYAYLGIEALAGKSTLADIGVNFLTDINVSVALAWAAGSWWHGIWNKTAGVTQRYYRATCRTYS